MELGVFQETKVTDGIYMIVLAGYRIILSDAPRRYCEGVDVFFQDVPHFQVKAIHPHGPNVTSFQLDSVRRHWFIVICYITSNK